eukprot:4512353-Alexandrium_andersonii.AAC.1
MSASLVGSEMCIRDSRNPPLRNPRNPWPLARERPGLGRPRGGPRHSHSCLLYTSDAADDM